MTPITPEQLAEWRELAEKATPGPWVARQPRVKIIVQSEDRQKAGWYISQDVLKFQDAEFVAASRVAVPALLAEVERLQAELVFLRDDFQKWQQSWDEAKKINEQYREWIKAKCNNDALEWAAAWVLESAKNTGQHEQFAANMAMSIRAAKRDVPMPTAEVNP